MSNKKDFSFPIDIVIPWVDGSDEKWISEKNKYAKEITSSVHDYNYKDWGLLKYWFRSIEANAPWVRYIYFVTCGQVPAWMDTKSNPKLKVVFHDEYIPQEYLPTFSSHVIELNFHRLPGLAEHFIYFNDDMYLIRNTKKNLFFKNGFPCDSAVVNPIAPASRNVISHLMLTNTAVINENFSKHRVIKDHPFKWFNPKYGVYNLLSLMFIPWGRFPGLYEQHLPVSYLKSTFEEVWDKESEILDQTCRHKFRDFKSDVNQWLMKDWQIAEGKFEPRRVNCGYAFHVRNMEDAKKVKKALKNHRYHLICVNDHVEVDEERVIGSIIHAFENEYPNKSSFEL